MTIAWRFVPLLGVLLFTGVCLVLRAWLHRRRFGTSGLVPFRDVRGPEGWLTAGGIGLTLAMALEATVVAVDPEAFARLHLVVPGPIPDPSVGAFVLVAGIAFVFAAQADLGASWRVGIDRTTAGTMVARGLYAVSRNPIYLGMFVTLAGFALLVPTWPSVALLAAGVVGTRQWVVWYEEPHLLASYGESYRVYAARVGRFVPGVGRLRGPEPSSRSVVGSGA